MAKHLVECVETALYELFALECALCTCFTIRNARFNVCSPSHSSQDSGASKKEAGALLGFAVPASTVIPKNKNTAITAIRKQVRPKNT